MKRRAILLLIAIILPLGVSFQSNIKASHHKYMTVRSISHKAHYRGGESILKETERTLLQSSTSLGSLVPRISTGALLVAISVICSVAGKGIFSSYITLVSILGHKEYNELVGQGDAASNNAIRSVLSVAILIFTHYFPQFHEYTIPGSMVALVIYFLSIKGYLATIREVSAALLGIIYLGYLPSWWIRLRILGDSDSVLSKAFSWPDISVGAQMVLWTWLSIACADSCAYAVGKMVGRHKLSVFSKVMSVASPGKTVEGVVGGVLSSVFLNSWGAYQMQWPLWKVSGPLYGFMISVVAFFGDLLESLMKRDAGVKDSGHLLPGHGGVLDRTDSLMLTAPIAFLFWKVIFPALCGTLKL